jgi:hypothetical protein
MAALKLLFAAVTLAGASQIPTQPQGTLENMDAEESVRGLGPERDAAAKGQPQDPRAPKLHPVPAATSANDAVTTTDIPHREPMPAKTPTPDPELLATNPHHSDNALSEQLRAMRPREMLNAANLRRASEQAHQKEGGHSFPGMTHTG